MGRVHGESSSNFKLATMAILRTLLATMAISSTYSKSLDTVNKASSPYTNCGCQCSSLTFRDIANIIQGNCKTVDSTGAQWCYMDSAHSTCQDLVPSQRFPHNPWSYEGCATPALGSHVCPNYPAYPSHPTIHHPATPTAVLGHPVVLEEVLPIGPVVEETLPIGPIFAQGGLPLGPPVIQGGLPLGPAGVDTFPGDARQTPEEEKVLADERGTLSGLVAPSK